MSVFRRRAISSAHCEREAQEKTKTLGNQLTAMAANSHNSLSATKCI